MTGCTARTGWQRPRPRFGPAACWRSGRWRPTGPLPDGSTMPGSRWRKSLSGRAAISAARGMSSGSRPGLTPDAAISCRWRCLRRSPQEIAQYIRMKAPASKSTDSHEKAEQAERPGDVEQPGALGQRGDRGEGNRRRNHGLARVELVVMDVQRIILIGKALRLLRELRGLGAVLRDICIDFGWLFRRALGRGRSR